MAARAKTKPVGCNNAAWVAGVAVMVLCNLFLCPPDASWPFALSLLLICGPLSLLSSPGRRLTPYPSLPYDFRCAALFVKRYGVFRIIIITVILFLRLVTWASF